MHRVQQEGFPQCPVALQESPAYQSSMPGGSEAGYGTLLHETQQAREGSVSAVCLWTFTATRGLVTHTHPFNGPFSGTTQVSRYQKGKTNLDFTEARDSEWQWHRLGHMQVCTSLQTDNHSSIPLLSFLQAGCPSCRPTNSVKALE